jgi:hypothetical protein
MLKPLRATARFIQNTIGWNRIGVLLSITIITVAVVVLVRMLRDIDVNEVFRAPPGSGSRRPRCSSPAAISR